MKKFGIISSILFLCSLAAFMFAFVYRETFVFAGVALGTFFFLAGIADLTFMVMRRKSTGRI